MLLSHAFVVAAIFTAYLASMVALVAYICLTGHRQDSSDDDEPEQARA